MFGDQPHQRRPEWADFGRTDTVTSRDNPPRTDNANELHDIHTLCAHDARRGVQFCQELAPGDPSQCAQVCLDDYRDAHRPAPAPVRLTVPAQASAAPPPPPPPDPYLLALGNCVRRVRDDGQAPVCSFFRPLDQMDFGQRHCDAKCAELTDGFRRASTRP
jgi:hypothetical protein